MPKATAKTIADFRAAHDKDVIVPSKIRKALAAIEAEGNENWDYETDFMKRAGISSTELSTYRAQFLDHIVEASERNRAAKRVWVGAVKVARKLRGE